MLYSIDFTIGFSYLDNDALIGSMNKNEERKTKKGLKSDHDHIRSKASQRNNIDTNVMISHRIVAKQSRG